MFEPKATASPRLYTKLPWVVVLAMSAFKGEADTTALRGQILIARALTVMPSKLQKFSIY
jgi:hypothetical protein